MSNKIIGLTNSQWQLVIILSVAQTITIIGTIYCLTH